MDGKIKRQLNRQIKKGRPSHLGHPGIDHPLVPTSRGDKRSTGQGHAYSRSLTRPGIGTGYFPSALIVSGLGESRVSLSMFGANSCW